MKPAEKAQGGGGAGRGTARIAKQICPICGKLAHERHRPFCSRNCADVDLARWLGGRYAIPGEPVGDVADADAADTEDEPARSRP